MQCVELMLGCVHVRVWGWGVRVGGLEFSFRVWGLGFGFRVWSLRFGVQGFGFKD